MNKNKNTKLTKERRRLQAQIEASSLEQSHPEENLPDEDHPDAVERGHDQGEADYLRWREEDESD